MEKEIINFIKSKSKMDNYIYLYEPLFRGNDSVTKSKLHLSKFGEELDKEQADYIGVKLEGLIKRIIIYINFIF